METARDAAKSGAGASPTEVDVETAASRSDEPDKAQLRSSRLRTRPSFRQVDVTRAMKGARAGGLEVGRLEIDATGKIVLFAKDELNKPLNAFDEWKQGRNARSA